MKNFDNYFYSVFKGTYLSKREKQVWLEEMQGHLEASIEQAIKRGLTEHEAHASAFASFGTAREVRRRIIRETYGVSPRWFLTLSLLCLTVFVTSLFVQMRMNDVIPSTLTPIPTPRWVVYWNHNLFLSHLQAWIGLAVLLFMYVFTRKRSDRIAVFLSLTPFCIVWLIGRMTHEFSMSSMVFAGYPIMAPLGPPEMTGYLMLLAVCLAVYTWTRNRIVSLTPWILSIILTIWPILRDTVQTALWNLTSNPIFWGHAYPDAYYLWWSILTILVRLIVLGLFIYGCRKVDAIRFRKSHTA
ncbi:hypothetical protein AAC03nite_36780 [Alicyclobacillus acidoterrestris]|uniref:permease prefix domain 1-containing protein n=1 Tax=Alicyclobacillus suci TaxID=2816080 RepID=UPI0011926AB1|nr:permease prefix domain 1-containing protein [Alicyclobacillus suci]GEO27893.1 hypothetical protein AAC03nite_36780 [Alicyclobacillus acidoterrestris]